MYQKNLFIINYLSFIFHYLQIIVFTIIILMSANIKDITKCIIQLIILFNIYILKIFIILFKIFIKFGAKIEFLKIIYF